MIGLLDSGVGGLYVLRHLRALLPHADLCYLGDTRHLPYGTRPPQEICALARQAATFLISHGADALLAACGTVSALALPLLRREFSLPFYGITTPTAMAVGRALGDHGAAPQVALLATPATIQDGTFARVIRTYAPHAPLHTRACPTFVPLAEDGAANDAAREAEVRRVLSPLCQVPVAVVVLGCTHFSALAPQIAACFPGACLIDGAAEGAAAAARALPASARRGSGRCFLYTSGDPDAFSRRAAAVLGEELPVRPVRGSAQAVPT